MKILTMASTSPIARCFPVAMKYNSEDVNPSVPNKKKIYTFYSLVRYHKSLID